MQYAFFVHGKPATKGSFKAFVHRRGKKAGTAFVVNSDAKCKAWQRTVAQTAKAAGIRHPRADGVHVDVTFVLPRPKAHYGTGRNAGTVKASAPPYPLKQPDIDKLLRALLDGLTNIAYDDDSQIISCNATKEFGEEPGAQVCVIFMEETAC